MATYLRKYSKPTTPLASLTSTVQVQSSDTDDEFRKLTEAASNTGRILNAALDFNVHEIGIGVSDSRFTRHASVHDDHRRHFLFAELCDDAFPTAQPIAVKAKVGNGSNNQFPEIAFMFEQNLLFGIYIYRNGKWHKSTPA